MGHVDHIALAALWVMAAMPAQAQTERGPVAQPSAEDLAGYWCGEKRSYRIEAKGPKKLTADDGSSSVSKFRQTDRKKYPSVRTHFFEHFYTQNGKQAQTHLILVSPTVIERRHGWVAKDRWDTPKARPEILTRCSATAAMKHIRAERAETARIRAEVDAEMAPGYAAAYETMARTSASPLIGGIASIMAENRRRRAEDAQIQLADSDEARAAAEAAADSRRREQMLAMRDEMATRGRPGAGQDPAFTPQLLADWGSWTTTASVDGEPVMEISVRDNECEDGDVLRVFVNDKRYFEGEIQNEPQKFRVAMNPGTNKIRVVAVNGTGHKGNCNFADENTGEITVASLARGGSVNRSATQTWSVRGGTGTQSNITVTTE